MRQINLIVIHCSATPEGRDYTVQDIDRWHRARGWRCIGYHYVIYRDGSIHRGRPESEIGAHVSGKNANSIGICYIGGLKASPVSSSNGFAVSGSKYIPADTRTPEQKSALLRLLTELKNRYPNAEIHGHNEYANKACPCFDAHAEYRQL